MRCLKLALLVSCGCVLVETTVLSPVSTVSVPKNLAGQWLAEDINDGGVIDDLQTTLEINDDGTYAGFAGCNSYTGVFDIANGEIVFGPAGMTEEICLQGIMNQEANFLNILKAGPSFRIEEMGLVLTQRVQNRPCVSRVPKSLDLLSGFLVERL